MVGFPIYNQIKFKDVQGLPPEYHFLGQLWSQITRNFMFPSDCCLDPIKCNRFYYFSIFWF